MYMATGQNIYKQSYCKSVPVTPGTADQYIFYERQHRRRSSVNVRHFAQKLCTKISKMPEFYMIFALKLSKCPDFFYDICPKMPEFYMIIDRKKYFSQSPTPLSESYSRTPTTRTFESDAQLLDFAVSPRPAVSRPRPRPRQVAVHNKMQITYFIYCCQLLKTVIKWQCQCQHKNCSAHRQCSAVRLKMCIKLWEN